MIRRLAAILYLAASAAPTATSTASAAETINFLAAASATEAVTAISRRIGRDLGLTVRPAFAASSTLASQIAAGAPAHLFLSANVGWADYLQDKGLITAAGRVDLLGNRLVLLSRRKTEFTYELASGASLAAALGDGRLVMGDPAHVPAGRYARQALSALGLWRQVRDRAVFGASVRDALALIVRGYGRAAITYATDARLHGDLRLVSVFPADSHDAIIYPLLLIAGRDNHEARKVFGYLQDDAAGAIFRELGFSFLPGRE
ncbi:MAG: molybdate ABC transporter substrate-binding protein [Alphaproteobacteria bacterium]|jgi:molybdate transport system substrate-binding protein|nr:molybdate ABC transporter substrate-binding protein [Alphaproteobacteria bacterium]MDP6565728.1 molybdate ABC transporter substrate-binding protein [Alphaproteobacteria bacterium]MDP6814602.1 molybdate ABC transporter substrate-binding protein [Alphaproteobacteria bacterium]